MSVDCCVGARVCGGEMYNCCVGARVCGLLFRYTCLWIVV